MVLIASTLVAFVKIAGATMNVSTANGFCVSRLLPMIQATDSNRHASNVQFSPLVNCEPGTGLHFFRERAELDVAEGNRTVVALQRDVTAAGLGEERHFAKFAFGDAGVEIVAADDVFKILHAVDFMDALFRADDEADMIPFADGLGGVENLAGRRINRWLIERVKPAATNRVSGFGIVLQLKFRTGRPHRAAIIR